MSQQNEDRRRFERRITTTGEEKARIERALHEASQQLALLEPSGTAQRWKSSAEGFRRILLSWTTHPPTRAQLAIVQEHVAELLEAVTQGPRANTLRRSA